MKAEPASPDQRVPSQSKTAMRGESAWTAAWKAGVVRMVGVGLRLDCGHTGTGYRRGEEV